MKKRWMLVLMISVGLNIGLSLRLARPGHPFAVPGPEAAGGGRSSRWDRAAEGDSTVWEGFMGRRIERLADSLNLTPVQVEAFWAAQRSNGRQLHQKRRELFQARRQLRMNIVAGEIDLQAVRLAMAGMGRRQAELDSLAAETLLQELAVLDPAQRAQYLDFLPPEGGHEPGRGRRGRERPGG